jgi:hypothetical protein
MQGWDNFFVAEAGAAAALTRAAETLISLVSVLVVSTFILVPEQSMRTYGI